MNKDNAKDYLPLVQALAEGKVIQEAYCHFDGSELEWRDIVGEVDLSGSTECYRIKPEPREIFVVIDKDDDGSYLAFLSEDDAIKDSGNGGYEIRRYREVIE